MAGPNVKRSRGCPRCSKECGAAMVEFAVVFLLLFTMVTLIAEGGFFFMTWLAVTNGAREGARYAATCVDRHVPGEPWEICSTEDVKNLVIDRTSGFIDRIDELRVDLDGPCTVTVMIRTTVSSASPILGDLPITGQSTMRLETSPTGCSSGL